MRRRRGSCGCAEIADKAGHRRCTYFHWPATQSHSLFLLSCRAHGQGRQKRYTIHQILSPAPQYALYSPVSGRSAPNPSASLSNEDLTMRVANLEALIQAEAVNAHVPSTRLNQPAPRMKRVLSTSDLGHIRFISSTASSGSTRPVSDPQQATSRSIDVSAGPYPLGKKHNEVHSLFVHLPSRIHCRHLKEVYFESFAPVCLISS